MKQGTARHGFGAALGELLRGDAKGGSGGDIPVHHIVDVVAVDILQYTNVRTAEAGEARSESGGRNAVDRGLVRHRIVSGAAKVDPIGQGIARGEGIGPLRIFVETLDGSADRRGFKRSEGQGQL